MSDYTRYLFTTLLFAILLIVGLEVNYLYGIKAPESEVSAKLITIDKTQDKNFEHVLFGDSVAHKALRGTILKDDVLDLSTTAGTNFAGLFFMLKRFLKNNNTTKKVHIIFTPFFLKGKKEIDRNFSLWFDRDLERTLMSSYIKKPLSSTEIYVNNRANSVNLYNFFMVRLRLKREKYSPPKELEEGILFTPLSKENAGVDSDLAYTSYFLDKLIALCASHKIELQLMIAPMAKPYYKEAYIDTKLPGFFSSLKGIEFKDLNKIIDIKDDGFYDGHHLRTNWAKYFLNELDTRLFKLIKR
ncbi:MAG: hypothetical protein ACJAT2_001945 [Bacteriovoracaceae bacterium]|jgi:hypothetical protein